MSPPEVVASGNHVAPSDRREVDGRFDSGQAGSTTIVLMRHGRTRLNAENRLQGRLDAPLDDVGIAQAEAVGSVVRERWNVARVVTSPLLRARQTVEHAGLADLPTTVDDRFLELDYGAADGSPVGEAVSALVRAWSEDPAHEPPGGGESLTMLNSRISAACDELASAPEGEVILVVTHATPVKAALVWALGGDPSMILRLHASPASLSVLGKSPGGFVVLTYNEQLSRRTRPEVAEAALRGEPPSP